MLDGQIKNEIVYKLSLLEHTILNRSDAGVRDVYEDLEMFAMDTLNITRGWNLVNANSQSYNAPAVDLVDETSRVAIQITTNCTGAKITKTINGFIENELDKKYSDLYIVGIGKVGKSSSMKPWTHVSTLTRALDVSSLELSKKIQLRDRLSCGIPWQYYSNMNDRHCFDVVLTVLNRDAIRHSYHMEGDFHEMRDALGAIKEIATQGHIRGTDIRAKPRSNYAPEYHEILDLISTEVGKMRQITSNQNIDEYGMLDYKKVEALTQIRNLLVQSVNEFSAVNNFDTRIEISGNPMEFGSFSPPTRSSNA
ncbi:hypothetical protein CBI33_22760 [Rhodococcus erythropolis]|nr:hypothetical protein CBI33_22760 [Rhodococcus erythropolis]